MKKSVLAVCDLEASYAYNFMEYMNQKRSIPFEVQAFTGPEHVITYAQKNTIEILLISDKSMCAEVASLNIGKIMILSEGVHYPALDQYPSVYKYQSSNAVIREVMACYGEGKEGESPAQVLKKQTEIIGIYSPLGRVLKTSFALTLGQILAREKAVLYINMEEYSGFEQLFSITYERNLGDLIYYIRQENSNLIYKLNSMVQSVNNLDYLPPALSGVDVLNTTAKEWIHLLKQISCYSAYEVIILDLGDGVDELYQIMGMCSRIYMPILSDPVSQAKIVQFENILRMWDCQEVLDKTQKIKPPYHNSFGESENYVQQLMWSELGDYVRNLIRKEGN